MQTTRLDSERSTLAGRPKKWASVDTMEPRPSTEGSCDVVVLSATAGKWTSRQLWSLTRVQAYAEPGLALRNALDPRAAVVVIDLQKPGTFDPVRFIRQVREGAPAKFLIAYVDLSASFSSLVISVARAGVNAVAVAGASNIQAEIRRGVRAYHRQLNCSELMNVIGPRLHPRPEWWPIMSC